jgi:hypothetical protein
MSKRNVVVTNVIDKGTGELIRQRRTFADALFDEDEGYVFQSKKPYVKTFFDTPLPKEFTWSEKGKLSQLKFSILSDNQLLVYRGNNNIIKPYGTREFEKMWGVHERQTQNLIKKAKEYKVLKEISIDGIKYFAFNPLYGTKGKRLTVTAYLIFQNELREVLPGWVIAKFADQAEIKGLLIHVIE